MTVGLVDKLDSNGALLEELEVISGDGLAILQLPKGTRILDAHGQAFDSITVTAKPAQASGQYIFLSGLAYDFGPDGARFDPPARLSISYDPALLPLNVDETRSKVAYFDAAESAWTCLDAMVDPEAQRLVVDINHLGTFAVSFDWFAPPVS